MLIYIFAFGISILLINLSGKIKKSFAYHIVLVLALLIPTIVAGVRDYSIGADVRGYGNYWYKQACVYDNYFTFIKVAGWSSIDPGYASLNYVVSRFTDNPHWFYFALNGISNILIYFGLKRNEDICNVSLGMSVYYFIFWGITLNALRQSIAIALVFWGYYYVRKNNVFKFYLTVALATTFHKTALIAVVIHWLHFALNAKIEKKFSYFVIGVSSVFLLFSWQILTFLGKKGFIASRYLNYFRSDSVGGGMIVRIVLYGTVSLVLFFLVNNKEHYKELNDFRVFAIYSLLLSTLSCYNAQSVRLAHYLDFFIIYGISYAVNKSYVKSKDTKLLYYLIMLLALIYFIVIFGYRHSDQIVPFVYMKS